MAYLNEKILIDFKKSYGVGIKTTTTILKKMGLNYKKQKLFLNTTQQKKLKRLTKKKLYNLKLKNKLKEIILFPQKIKSYSGLRNKYKYPCRGQRTRTNAKTKKKIKV
jgi:small subunit ribosomal protein S13